MAAEQTTGPCASRLTTVIERVLAERFGAPCTLRETIPLAMRLSHTARVVFDVGSERRTAIAKYCGVLAEDLCEGPALHAAFRRELALYGSFAGLTEQPPLPELLGSRSEGLLCRNQHISTASLQPRCCQPQYLLDK